MSKPKGLAIVLEFAEWHVGWGFSKYHCYISVGWVSLHVYFFAYLEHVSKLTDDIALAVIAGLAKGVFDKD